MANSKCPGTDGLPIEWYKTFYPQIKDFLCKLFQEIVESNELHLTARRGIISLLEKPEKDELYLDSWRSLSLLNSDYKIYTKILALRLEKVLPNIIHSSQTGFLKSRYMGENILKMLNLIEYCNRTRTSVIILSVDFQKAFDSIEWHAVDAVLEKMGVGPKFREKISIIYNKPVSCAYNNGYWSQFFQLSRGNRQGNPLSVILFITTMEALAVKLRVSVKIRGIDMDSFELKNNHYADDLWLALDPTEENISNTLNEFEQFTAFSGLVINYDKSVAKLIGPLKDTDARFYSLKQLIWSDGHIKVLGIFVHHDKEMLQKLNFDDMLKKVKNILSNWSFRSLMVIGKIAIVNSLVHPLFYHK